MDVKTCLDGSSVGRSGPNCEFAPCPAAKLSPTPADETTNWKTYTNKKYGFELRYPAEWNITENSDRDPNIIEIYPSNEKISNAESSESPFTEIRIVIKDNPRALSYKDFALEEEKAMYASGDFISTLKFGGSISVGGVQTEIVTGHLPTWSTKGVYLPYKDKMYTILASNSEGRSDVQKMIEEKFDEIISTFKFTQ